MPVNIQPATLKYKNSNGVYQSADCLKGDKGDPGAAGNAGLIAPDYGDLTFPVKNGQHCTYDSGYYEAKQDIATSETWTEAHWTNLGNVGNETEAIKTECAEIELIKQQVGTYLTNFDYAWGSISASNGYLNPGDSTHKHLYWGAFRKTSDYHSGDRKRA